MVPGTKLYSDVHRLNTLILSDSMIGNISTKLISEDIDGNYEKVIVKKYPGQTAQEIFSYSDYQFSTCKPDQVIIIAGSNDVSNGHRTRSLDEVEVATNIINIGRRAVKHGAKRIVISGLVIRKWNSNINQVIGSINRLVQDMCKEEGFYFIDQTDIERQHLWKDGLHLNQNGSYIFRMNIMKFFNTFNPYLCSFGDHYENAL